MEELKYAHRPRDQGGHADMTWQYLNQGITKSLCSESELHDRV